MSNLMKFRARLRPAAIAVPHWLTVLAITLGTSFVGGAEQYLQAIPMSDWITDLTDPKALGKLAVGALVSGSAALLAQGLLMLKQWAASAPPPPPAGQVVVSAPPEQT